MNSEKGKQISKAMVIPRGTQRFEVLWDFVVAEAVVVGESRVTEVDPA